MAVWWDRTTADERRKIGELPTVRRLTRGAELDEASYSPAVRDVLLEALFASGSDLVLNVIQDVFGWSDRINEPATVGDGNWTFRLPWPCDLLGEVAEARERQAALIEWTRRYKRLNE
jgi:4-alpha-glucanotransferase